MGKLKPLASATRLPRLGRRREETGKGRGELDCRLATLKNVEGTGERRMENKKVKKD